MQKNIHGTNCHIKCHWSENIDLVSWQSFLVTIEY